MLHNTRNVGLFPATARESSSAMQQEQPNSMVAPATTAAPTQPIHFGHNRPLRVLITNANERKRAEEISNTAVPTEQGIHSNIQAVQDPQSERALNSIFRYASGTVAKHKDIVNIITKTHAVFNLGMPSLEAIKHNPAATESLINAYQTTQNALFRYALDSLEVDPLQDTLCTHGSNKAYWCCKERQKAFDKGLANQINSVQMACSEYNRSSAASRSAFASPSAASANQIAVKDTEINLLKQRLKESEAKRREEGTVEAVRLRQELRLAESNFEEISKRLVEKEQWIQNTINWNPDEGLFTTGAKLALREVERRNEYLQAREDEYLPQFDRLASEHGRLRADRERFQTENDELKKRIEDLEKTLTTSLPASPKSLKRSASEEKQEVEDVTTLPDPAIEALMEEEQNGGDEKTELSE